MAWLEKRNGVHYVCQRQGRTVKRIKAYTDKQASKQKLAQFETAIAHGETGLADPFKGHKARPLPEHVADYVADLAAVGRDDKYVSNIERRLNKLLTECVWKTLPDVTADSFCRWRETLPRLDDGRTCIGPVTINQYLEAIRAFGKWCVKRKRIGSNPVADVDKVDETGDVRRARRALSAEQVQTLLDTVPTHYRPVYRFILCTGLRRQELADLQWGDVRLNAPSPFLQLRAKVTKARRADVLPLRADLAAELRTQRGDAADTDQVFPALPTMDEHREYLTAAGIEWEDSEGRRADFHSLRHTYGTLLSKAGVSPREAMSLMRHTDMRLTMNVYTDPRIFDLSGAVEKLPAVADSVQTVQATGTDDAVAGDSSEVAHRVARIASDRRLMADIVPPTAPAGRLQTTGNEGDNTQLAQLGRDRQGGQENSGGRTRIYSRTLKNKGSDASQGSAQGSAHPISGELQAVIDAWPALPAGTRAAIIEITRLAKGAPEGP